MVPWLSDGHFLLHHQAAIVTAIRLEIVNFLCFRFPLMKTLRHILADMFQTCGGNGHFLLHPVGVIPVGVIPGGVIQSQGQIQALVTTAGQ